MMFCNKCGAQLDDTAVFCGQCGNPISGGKQTGQKAMQPGARAVQRKTIYAIGALLAAVVVTGIIVAFGIRSAGKSEESDFYGTWTTLDGFMTITLEEDGIFEMRADGIDEVESGSFTDNKDGTITLNEGEAILGYERSGDTMFLMYGTNIGGSYYVTVQSFILRYSESGDAVDQ